MLLNEIKEYTLEIVNEVVNIRREIHRNPEIGLKEFKTSELIIRELKRLNLDIISGIAKTGVTGLLKGKNPNRTFAVRADMDALPIVEQNNHSFVSANKGFMHACGHDVHVALVLGTAMVLNKMQDKLDGNVKFIFQPGEEGYAGAKKMVNNSVLESPDVDAIVAAHVAPSLETGQISVCKGPAMASPSEFKIIIKGKGGHAAQPHDCVNPILISCNLIDLLQKIVVPKINPVEDAILSVTSFNSGNTYNVIPGESTIMGTVRTFDPSLDYRIFKKIEHLVETITHTFDVGYKFFYEVGYPPVINDENIWNLVVNTSNSILGSENVFGDQKALMLAEDFSYYSQEIPGAIFNLGCNNPNNPSKQNLHSSRFDPDEGCIPIGIELLSKMVFDYFSS